MADDTLAFVLIALATYRVATDIAYERGPFSVFERWRGWVMARFGGDHWISDGVTCPICLSFWAATALLLLWQFAPIGVWWLAVAGAAAWMARRGE